jgi:DNA-binding HxlR family transcriptional regulator
MNAPPSRTASRVGTMTAAQRRERDRLAYNAYVAECPSRQVLDALSDKWVALVLRAAYDRVADVNA